MSNEQTRELLVPAGVYVLVKRFTAKEERRRVVACIYDSHQIEAPLVGFENHLNYFHFAGRGLTMDLAKGLAGFLNSSVVDAYFRQFNGHTQVNATDLRSLNYPTKAKLEKLGRSARIKRRDAMEILRALGFTARQSNEVAGYTLLALLDLNPSQPWSSAGEPLRGITPIIDFVAEAYGVRYAPNTRETIRDEAVKYFVEAGMLIRNPDDPNRPTNSGKTAYQAEPNALELFRSFGTLEWSEELKSYLAARDRIRKNLIRERKLTRIPVRLPSGETVTISPGGQNPLIKTVIEEFCPCFVPGGTIVYIGDAEDKFLHLDKDYLQ